MPHNVLPVIDFKLIAETLGGVSLGALTFFGKRTLRNYDRRIATGEQNDKKILEALGKIEVNLEILKTVVEERTSKVVHSNCSQEN